MINKTAGLVGVCAFIIFLSWSTNVLGAAIQGSGTSTYVSVFSDASIISGFSDFVFVSSTKRLGILTSSPLSTVSIAGSPFESSTSALVLLDSNSIVDGNASGTYIGANPQAFNGDFINFEVSSTSKFKVAGSGSLMATNLAITNLSNGVMVASGTQVSTVAPGASGNILSSNGSSWTSSALPPAAAVSSTIASFIFGETVSAGKAVYIGNGAPLSKSFSVDSGSTLTNGLVAYYKLGDATDFWSTNNLTNNNSVAFSTGKVDNAANTGSGNTNKSLTISNNLGIDGGAISVSLWIKYTDLPSTIKTIWGQASASGSHVGYAVEYDGTTLTFNRFKNGVSDNVVSETVTLNTGTWYHLVLTYDGTTLEGWRDGVSKGTLATSGSGTSAPPAEFTLFERQNVRYTSGLIDEVGVWNKKLSNTEVADLYNSGLGQTMDAGGNGVAGRAYGASATDRLYSDGFIGFAATTTSASSTGNVVIGGLANNISGVSAGKQYYLGNSSGTISLAPGTVTRKVGIGVATDTLLITNIW